MVLSLATITEKQTMAEVHQANFIGIIMDESCDVAVFKKLIIYLQIVVRGRVKVNLIKYL